MDWTITENDILLRDFSGVEGLIERMDGELRGGGTPIEGFRLLSDANEMLAFSREIEREIRANPSGADLYAGFQNTGRLYLEADRFRRLVRSGVRVAAFGQCQMESPPEGLEGVWTPLERNTRALENQWFLVSSHPAPIALVGWEISPEKMFGVGGLSSPGKQFRGFITNDGRVVHSIIANLESVRARSTRPGEAGAGNRVRRVLAVTSLDDSPEYAVVRSCAAGMAAAGGGEVVLFEITAASYLVSPYPEENRRQWIRTLREPELRRLGRSPVARQMEVIRARGTETQAILPTAHGFKHLAEWAEREDADLILIPVSLVNPGLFDRLRGYSLKTLLEHTKRPVLVVYPNGTTRRANPGEPSYWPEPEPTPAALAA